MKKFTVAGTSNLNGVVKARFANGLPERVKILTKGKHTDIKLFELPNAMTKEDAAKHIITAQDYKEGSVEYIALNGKLDKIATFARRDAKGTALKSKPVATKVPTKTVDAAKGAQRNEKGHFIKKTVVETKASKPAEKSTTAKTAAVKK